MVKMRESSDIPSKGCTKPHKLLEHRVEQLEYFLHGIFSNFASHIESEKGSKWKCCGQNISPAKWPLLATILKWVPEYLEIDDTGCARLPVITHTSNCTSDSNLSGEDDVLTQTVVGDASTLPIPTVAAYSPQMDMEIESPPPPIQNGTDIDTLPLKTLKSELSASIGSQSSESSKGGSLSPSDIVAETPTLTPLESIGQDKVLPTPSFVEGQSATSVTTVYMDGESRGKSVNPLTRINDETQCPQKSQAASQYNQSTTTSPVIVSVTLSSANNTQMSKRGTLSSIPSATPVNSLGTANKYSKTCDVQTPNTSFISGGQSGAIHQAPRIPNNAYQSESKNLNKSRRNTLTRLGKALRNPAAPSTSMSKTSPSVNTDHEEEVIIIGDSDDENEEVIPQSTACSKRTLETAQPNQVCTNPHVKVQRPPTKTLMGIPGPGTGQPKELLNLTSSPDAPSSMNITGRRALTSNNPGVQTRKSSKGVTKLSADRHQQVVAQLTSGISGGRVVPASSVSRQDNMKISKQANPIPLVIVDAKLQEGQSSESDKRYDTDDSLIDPTSCLETVYHDAAENSSRIASQSQSSPPNEVITLESDEEKNEQRLDECTTVTRRPSIIIPIGSLSSEVFSGGADTASLEETDSTSPKSPLGASSSTTEYSASSFDANDGVAEVERQSSPESENRVNSSTTTVLSSPRPPSLLPFCTTKRDVEIGTSSISSPVNSICGLSPSPSSDDPPILLPENTGAGGTNQVTDLERPSTSTAAGGISKTQKQINIYASDSDEEESQDEGAIHTVLLEDDASAVVAALSMPSDHLPTTHLSHHLPSPVPVVVDLEEISNDPTNDAGNGNEVGRLSELLVPRRTCATRTHYCPVCQQAFVSIEIMEIHKEEHREESADDEANERDRNDSEEEENVYKGRRRSFRKRRESKRYVDYYKDIEWKRKRQQKSDSESDDSKKDNPAKVTRNVFGAPEIERSPSLSRKHSLARAKSVINTSNQPGRPAENAPSKRKRGRHKASLRNFNKSHSEDKPPRKKFNAAIHAEIAGDWNDSDGASLQKTPERIVKGKHRKIRSTRPDGTIDVTTVESENGISPDSDEKSAKKLKRGGSNVGKVDNSIGNAGQSYKYPFVPYPPPTPRVIPATKRSLATANAPPTSPSSCATDEIVVLEDFSSNLEDQRNDGILRSYLQQGAASINDESRDIDTDVLSANDCDADAGDLDDTCIINTPSVSGSQTSVITAVASPSDNLSSEHKKPGRGPCDRCGNEINLRYAKQHYKGKDCRQRWLVGQGGYDAGEDSQTEAEKTPEPQVSSNKRKKNVRINCPGCQKRIYASKINQHMRFCGGQAAKGYASQTEDDTQTEEDDTQTEEDDTQTEEDDVDREDFTIKPSTSAFTSRKTAKVECEACGMYMTLNSLRRHIRLERCRGERQPKNNIRTAVAETDDKTAKATGSGEILKVNDEGTAKTNGSENATTNCYEETKEENTSSHNINVPISDGGNIVPNTSTSHSSSLRDSGSSKYESLEGELILSSRRETGARINDTSSTEPEFHGVEHICEFEDCSFIPESLQERDDHLLDHPPDDGHACSQSSCTLRFFDVLNMEAHLKTHTRSNVPHDATMVSYKNDVSLQPYVSLEKLNLGNIKKQNCSRNK